MTCFIFGFSLPLVWVAHATDLSRHEKCCTIQLPHVPSSFILMPSGILLIFNKYRQGCLSLDKDASVSARQVCEDFAWALIRKWRRLGLCFSSSHTSTIYSSINWELLIHAPIITLHVLICINMLCSHLPLPYSLLPEVYLGFPTVYMISGILLPEPQDNLSSSEAQEMQMSKYLFQC